MFSGWGGEKQGSSEQDSTTNTKNQDTNPNTANNGDNTDTVEGDTIDGEVADLASRFAQSTATESAGSSPIVTSLRETGTPSSAPSSPALANAATVALEGPLEYITGMQLSRWDNIVGPKCVQFWAGHEALDEQMQFFVTRHTLDGELHKPDSETGSLDLKFNILHDSGLIISSAVFSANFGTGLCKAGLSLLFRKEHLSRYLVLHTLMEDQLLRLGAKLRALVNQAKSSQPVLTDFQPIQQSFCRTIESLMASRLSRLSFERTWFATLSGTNTSDAEMEFLALALSSHLQTHGVTIVIGSDRDTVNDLIDTLAMFLSPIEKRISMYSSNDSTAYVPGLFLQGLPTSVTLTDEDLIQSGLPSTVVNLDARTVHQCRLFHEYQLLRGEFLETELDLLFRQQRGAQAWSPPNGLLTPVKTSAQFVRSLVQEAVMIPLALRESYISQKVRLLLRKTVAAIKFVEAELLVNPGTQAPALQKKLRQELSVPTDADFSVILAYAEKLCPGMYTTVASNPVVVTEKMIELIEGF